MKKLLFSLLLFFAVSFGFSQTEQRVATITELNSLGYTLGEPVFIGNINGVDVYRAEYATNGKCKGKRIWCRQCAGCCNSGYVDYDSTERVLSVQVNNINGQLYYYTETLEDWFLCNDCQ